MKYVNFVHDPEKQYRSTVPAVRPLSIGLQVTEISRPCFLMYLVSSPARRRRRWDLGRIDLNESGPTRAVQTVGHAWLVHCRARAAAAGAGCQWGAAAALVRVGCCRLLAPVGTAQLVYHDLWGYHSSWYQAGHRQFVAHDLALPARCCDLVAVP